MPVYHFNLHDDVNGTCPDWTGTELPDAVAAEREAVRLARASITDNAVLKRYGGECHLEITDHAGTPVFHLDLKITPASASHNLLSLRVHLPGAGAR